jgi:hypothetical protein
MVACIIIALSYILLLVWVKFAKITFCDEFVDYSPYFLFPSLLYLIIVHMVLVQKTEKVLCHNALFMTYVCSVIVIISSIDMAFSWMVLTLF